LYFHSYQFLFLFLPLALASFQLARRFGEKGRLGAMLCASLLFYGLWDVRFVPLLAASILINFAIGRALSVRHEARGADAPDYLLSAAVLLNLAVLFLFRYLPLAGTESGLLGAMAAMAAPLGILFFTLDQIGYLSDVRHGRVRDAGLLRYAAFASFFPRLIGGPLLRYGEIEPQLGTSGRRNLREDLAAGLTIFFFGLVKKALLADSIAVFAIPLSSPAAAQHPDIITAWTAALAFSCQIYFELSGYADMAIGLARCFGIRFPANFESPYQADNIALFWQRWNITLARYLGDYVYQPLGGSKGGRARNLANLAITMVLAGLWYGANWPLAAWGLLHGVYLTIHRLCAERNWLTVIRSRRWFRPSAIALTFLAVTLSWPLFRAPDFATAFAILQAMVGFHGVAWPQDILHLVTAWGWIVSLLAIVFLAPNTQQWLAQFRPVLGSSSEAPAGGRMAAWRWQFHAGWAAAFGVLAFAGLLSAASISQNLHWRF
jgi:D-alanyl-lipoteichoic acid acyltransferase DltB (MBOAT superfamily)